MTGCAGLGPLAGAGDRGDGQDPNALTPEGYEPTEEEQAWIDEHTATAGVWVKEFGDYRFVLVTMGEKPTGGYAVDINEIATSNGDWVIDVEFVSPAPGDMVTQALTYPYTFVKVKGEGGVKVRDVTGRGEPVEMAVEVED